MLLRHDIGAILLLLVRMLLRGAVEALVLHGLMRMLRMSWCAMLLLLLVCGAVEAHNLVSRPQDLVSLDGVMRLLLHAMLLLRFALLRFAFRIYGL